MVKFKKRYSPHGDQYMMVHDPKNKYKITRLYAWLSQDEDGTEGIVASLGARPIPFVFGDINLLEKTRPLVEEMRTLVGGNKKIIAAIFERVQDPPQCKNCSEFVGADHVCEQVRTEK